MDIVEIKQGAVVVIELRGRLDSNTSKILEEKLLAAIAPEQPAMVVDCGQLDYVSSAGLRVLLMAAKKVKAARGKLALCALKAHVQEVFDVSGFSSIFAIHPARAAALASVGG
ncbi:putative anti-sigma factor antagonist BtrV [uncultured Gammaproteobacteria bacterium]